MKKSNDIVFNILESMLRHSPERSYKRLNPALRSVLGDCIDADLPFQRDTFRRICDQLRGGRWFGDGAGSQLGEQFYTHACAVNHASAMQSFEQFAGRPGVLWEENTGTPERLHVGARFTWKGYYVEVTSMRTDSLVACTYQDVRDHAHGIDVGATISDYRSRNNKHWVITHQKREGKTAILRVQATPANSGDRTVAKRFTITYAEIAEFRRTEAKRVKAIVDAIAACNPAKDAKALTQRISAEHFRHFQLEKMKAAWSKRVAALSAEEKATLERERNQKAIQEWRAGANGAYLGIEENLLRIQGDQVQCSNGNCVSLAAVKRALPIVLARRATPGAIQLPLDTHTIENIGKATVRIGCTEVAWSEIERLQKAIA